MALLDPADGTFDAYRGRRFSATRGCFVYAEDWTPVAPAETVAAAPAANAVGIPLDILSARGALILCADLHSNGVNYSLGTVLARWRGELVVWTVGAYAGAAFEASNGDYFPDTSAGMTSARESYRARTSR